MKPTAYLFATLLGVLLIGCDGTGETRDAEPDPRFEVVLGAPISATLQGEAALGNGTSFEEQQLLVLPFPQGDKTLTAVQLYGRDAHDVPHDLSLFYIGDAPIEAGTYDLGFEMPCEDDTEDGCSPASLFPDEMLIAHYARFTSDTLYTYLVDRGTLTVERAEEDVVEGTFDLAATRELRLARTDLDALTDLLENGSPGTELDPTLAEFRDLTPPLTIEGQFTATPSAFVHNVPQLGGLMMSVDSP